MFEGFPQRPPLAAYVDDRGAEKPVNLSWQGALHLAEIHAEVVETLDAQAEIPHPNDMRSAVIELQRLEQGKGRKTVVKIKASCFELDVPYEFGLIRFCFPEPPEPVRVFNRNLKGREVEIPLKCTVAKPSPDLPFELYHEIENWMQS